jgi:hypothetical protein
MNKYVYTVSKFYYKFRNTYKQEADSFNGNQIVINYHRKFVFRIFKKRGFNFRFGKTFGKRSFPWKLTEKLRKRGSDPETIELGGQCFFNRDTVSKNLPIFGRKMVKIDQPIQNRSKSPKKVIKFDEQQNSERDHHWIWPMASLIFKNSRWTQQRANVYS